MREFFVGILVIILLGVLSVAGVLLIPVLLLMGFFLRIIVGIIVMIFVVWLVGKVALMSIDYLRNRDEKSGPPAVS